MILGGHLLSDLVVCERRLVQLRKEVGGVLVVDAAQEDEVGKDVVYEVVALLREDGLPIFRVAPAAEQILERALRQFRQQYGGLLLVLGLGGGVLQLGDCSSQDLDALLAGQEVEVGGAEEPDIVGVDGVKPPSGWGRAAL